ncbi:unnamed protein product [Rhizoctonia solani]|uniref:UFSP1/2/DUB catalytic domain-containing protein n=1 Tax=Rhizoctonia solani TaxID=456999 RepID=A0A8H3BFQ7_9AGAM|nr:unnamed protein product [Rhizoctonia solani]
MSETPVPTTDDDDMDYIFCELCREPLQELSLEDRQAHYEAHFNSADGLGTNELDAQLAASIAMQASSPGRGVVAAASHSSSHRVVAPQKPRENVFWHPACGSLAPRIATPGIIPILGRALGRPGSKGGALCSPLVTHYGTELWDLGCALAAQDIRPEYRGLLMDDICGPPGVRNLQVWIEDAWRRGYDTHGATELRHHLLGTRKWIGTAGPEESQTTPHVYMSKKMPIVLQHKGHSRTVVGIEFTKSGGTNLLIYDPARRPSAAIRKAGLKVHASGVSSINSNTLPHPQQHRHHGSSTKAKDFFKRVIKRRSRSRIDEQEPKRVRGGSAEVEDWEALGRGKGHKLGGSAVRDQSHNDPGLAKVTDPNSHINGETRVPEENLNLLATLQDLDLGRVLSAFRVTPSQLGKKDQYQILWFPMTSPLTGPERDACKVVRSERVTVSPVPTS